MHGHLSASSSGGVAHQSSVSPSFSIHPAVGLGPFRLGNSIGSCLQYVQQHAMQFRHNDLVCAPSHPTSADLTLDLQDVGVRLRFEPHQQRLTLIDVYDPNRLPLVYMRAFLTPSAGQPATFASLYALVGPTYASNPLAQPSELNPGSYDEAAQMYMLQYPGCCMAFHLPERPRVDGEHGQQVITLPDGSSPPLQRLFIHAGADVHEHASALPPIASTDTYFEPITVELGKGLFFERRHVWIGFDSYVQDLLSELGAPQNVFVKQSDNDKMNIHRHEPAQQQTHSPNVHNRHLPASSQQAAAMVRPPTADYFYNYFLLGLDVLLDGVTHRVKKFILHTNFVDRPDFAQYAKCNFTVVRDADDDTTSGRHHQHSAGAGPDLLELPPTAVPESQGGRSMLHPAVSHLHANASFVPSSEPASVSPPQTIQLHTGVEVTSAAAAAATSSAKSKKAKKKANGTAAASVDGFELDGRSSSKSSPLPPRPASGLFGSGPSQSSAGGVLSSSPPRALVSFSPSLSPSVLPQSHATVLTADSKWSDVLAVLGACPSRPMVSSSNSHTTIHAAAGGGNSATGGAAALHSPDNPFAATYFYAYPGAVFEVMRNHQLASVTLFKE